MNKAATKNWQFNNHSYLSAALAGVREALVQRVDPSLLDEEFKQGNKHIGEIPPESSIPSSEATALEQLCAIFGLSDFERDLLLLCAGVELDASFGLLCGAACGDSQRNYPTFGLAMTVLEDMHWGALTPSGALRKWQLIEVGSGSELMSSPLRIDERILHYLMGENHLDEQLLRIVEHGSMMEELVPSHWQVTQKMVAAWSVEINDFLKLPVLQLCGNEVASKRAIAALVCHFLGQNLYAIADYSIPTNPKDLHQFKILWEREVVLGSSVLLIDCDNLELGDTAKEGAIAYLCERLCSPIIITTTNRKRTRLRPMLVYDIARPTTSEQYQVWKEALGTASQSLNGQWEALVSQFNLSAPVIKATCSQVHREWQQVQKSQTKVDFNLLLWDSCRAQARPKLDDLAERIESSADWDDLVLPEAQMKILREISAHVKQRTKVYQGWGFGRKSVRGLGISALFAGVSGTGKTTAAEVLARELRLDLYRIDLSAVVSKYIGETEKNLRRVFDAAERGGVVLLFDEADALFGKRTEVKDSHDRHANVEVSYLLQRMETYLGLSVLTTNLKDSLDQAFLRRIRFMVHFPFPDTTTRAEIWRRTFPKTTPTEGLDFRRLARLNVTGGNIHNIALNGAFLAAEAGEAVTMKHLLEATKSEYLKLERTLTEAEIKGWG